MHEYKIQGINISFPYEAYNVQLEYMEKVISALNNKHNALLESPTGTGKTLCLLCATLGWQQHQSKSNASVPKIIYTSRTHSQISQVVSQLKLTSYIQKNEKVKSLVVASRSQYCINNEVNKNKQLTGQPLDTACKASVKQGSCVYFKGSKYFSSEFLYSAPDVEDLCCLGKGNEFTDNKGQLKRSSKFCPFYVAHEYNTNCNLIFSPYNYIIDKQLRDRVELQLENSILIIDEAHNIEREAEEAASFILNINDLKLSIQAFNTKLNANCKLSELLDNDKKNQKESRNDMNKIIKFIENLIKIILSIKLEMGKFNENIEMTSNRCVDLFKEAGLEVCFVDTLNLVIEEFTSSDIFDDQNSNFVRALSCLLKALGVVLGEDLKKYGDFYKFHIKKEKKTVFTQNSEDFLVIFSLFCLTPSITIKHLVKTENIYNLMITSGTLAPLNILSKHLGGEEIKFNVTLENDHVVEHNQYLPLVVTKFNNIQLNSSYQNRNSVNYINALGMLILEAVENTPQGVLLFFSSYAHMASTINKWTEQFIINKIKKTKEVFIEPQSSSECEVILRKYQNTILNRNRGAMLMAVFRGKIAEGIDFSDSFCRLVIIAGLPFPNLAEDRIQIKMDFLNKKSSYEGGLWYQTQALRACNQAAGRALRHKDDYGVILFADERFQESRIKNGLCLWIRKNLQLLGEGSCGHILQNFFSNFSENSAVKPKFKRKSYHQDFIETKVETNETKKDTKKTDPKQALLKFTNENQENDKSTENTKKIVIFNKNEAETWIKYIKEEVGVEIYTKLIKKLKDISESKGSIHEIIEILNLVNDKQKALNTIDIIADKIYFVKKTELLNLANQKFKI